MENLFTYETFINEGLFSLRVIYKNNKSKHHNKKGTFIKVREDGKYSILFDDGTEFAASPKYIFTEKDDDEINKTNKEKKDCDCEIRRNIPHRMETPIRLSEDEIERREIRNYERDVAERDEHVRKGGDWYIVNAPWDL